MKRMKFSFVAIVIALAAFAFTSAPRAIGIGTNCADELFYFPIKSGENLECLVEVELQQIDFTDFTVGDNDNVPEAGEIPEVVVSDAAPYGCDDSPQTVACAVGYASTQLQKNSSGIWEPKDNEIPRCCIRRESAQ